MLDVEQQHGTGFSEQPPGELLAKAREAKGMSRIEVSELLGLTVAVIRDIELSRFERFPSGIYTRGYVKNYCKLVHANESEVMTAYDRHGENYGVPEESPFGANTERDERVKVNRRPVLFLLLIAALTALTLWLIL